MNEYNVPCPLGSSCNRPYCQYEHALDSSQQSQHSVTSVNNPPSPVIVQEDGLTESDYIGYMANQPSSSHVPTMYGGAFPYSSFNVTQSLYAPEDPVLQSSLQHDASATTAPVYSSTVYKIPTTTQSHDLLYAQPPNYSNIIALDDTSLDGPVYPPTARVPPPPQYPTSVRNSLSSSTYDTSGAASFGAFHTPAFTLPKYSIEKVQSHQIHQPTSFHNQHVYQHQQTTQANGPTIMQIQDEDESIAYDDIGSVPQPVKTTQQTSRKREHVDTSSPIFASNKSASSLSSLPSASEQPLPARKRPPKPVKATSAVPAYVPTPIAELERQKKLKNATRRVSEEVKSKVKPVPRNRSPGADDFSVIDRFALPIDLADDEILNPQKRATIVPPKSKGNILDEKKSGENKSETVANAAASFSLSNRILAPPKKVKIQKTTVASNSRPVIGDNAEKQSERTHDAEVADKRGGGDDSSTTQKLPKKTNISDEIVKNETTMLTANKRLKGNSSIFDRLEKQRGLSVEDKSSADEMKKKDLDTSLFKLKRDRLNEVNARTKALVEMDRIIAEKERELNALITGKPSSNKKDMLKTSKAPVAKPLHQFNIDTVFGDVDDKLSEIMSNKKDLNSETKKNNNNDDLTSTRKTSIDVTAQPAAKPVLFDNDARKSDALLTTTLSTSTTTTTATTSAERFSFTKPTNTIKPTINKQQQKAKVLTAVEQMKNRFAALDTLNLSTTPAASSSTSASSTLEEYGFSKGEARKARLGTSTTSSKGRKLTPLDMYNKKIAYSLRLKFLEKIFDELKKVISNDDEAIETAVREEKAILDKIQTRVAYSTAIANSVKRIREAAASGQAAGGAASGVSHMDVLAGRHVGTFTFGLKSLASSTSGGRISEVDFYAKLSKKYLLTEGQLWENGFPRWSENELPSESQPRIAEIQPHNPISIKYGFVSDTILTRICNRCGKEYRLTKDGKYQAVDNTCVYHWGKAWKRRINGALDSRYTCCDQDLTVKGCVVGDLHVTETKRSSTLSDYAETPRPLGVGDPRSRKVYALDCEMVYGVWGPILARVSVVDVLDELVLDEIVRPEEEVVDANTHFSGLTKKQLESATCTFKEVRERLFELVNQETILIGHSLESDLKAMRVIHKKVVDTSVVFPHRLGPPKKRALKTITCEILQKIIQEGVDGHDSKEDASACMNIMLHKIEKMD